MVFSTRKTEKIMKMKQYILGCMTVAVVFGCSVASVKADDIYPPAWTRGMTNTTYQEWNFGTSANPAAPGVAYNPNGTPTATITGGIWSFIYDNHVGVWTLGASDSIDLSIPNTPLELIIPRTFGRRLHGRGTSAGHQSSRWTMALPALKALYRHFNSPPQWELVVGCNLSIWLGCRSTRRRRM